MKQRREQRRENARELSRKAGYRVVLEQFVLHQIDYLQMQTPFLDVMRHPRQDSRALYGMVTLVGFLSESFPEVVQLQRRYNSLVELTTRHLAMSCSMEEREKRLIELQGSVVSEMLNKIRDEVNKTIGRQF